jgi:hypothetical protein
VALGQETSGSEAAQILPFSDSRTVALPTSVFISRVASLFSWTYQPIVRVSEQINISVQKKLISNYTSTMDLHRILSELHAERKQIDEAIVVLERLLLAQGKKRRRRRPKSMTLVKPKGPHLVWRTGTEGSSSALHDKIPLNTAPGLGWKRES